MAIRMQQRRATAEQWLLADPVLAAGELGIETDTSSFKIGDGVNNWSLLDYFETSASIVEGTLDDYVPLTQKGAALGVATLDGTGQVPAEQLANATVDLTGYATEDYVDTAIENVVGLAPETLDTLAELADALGDNPAAITTLQSDVTALQTDKANSLNPEFTVEVQATEPESLSFNLSYVVGLGEMYADNPPNFDEYNGGIFFELSGNLPVNGDFPEFPTGTVVRIFTNSTEYDYFGTSEWVIQSELNSFTPGATYSWNVLLMPETPSQQTEDYRNLALNGNGDFDAALLEQQGLIVTFEKVELGTQSLTVNSELAYLDGVTSNIQAQLDAKLESSDLAGYATETYVNAAVSDIVASAPGALDTLNELAAALGDDANFASTVTSALASKADTNSPTFTGLTDFQGIVDFSDSVVVGIDALPDQTGNDGKYLTTDGNTASWQTVASPVPHPFVMIG